MPAQHRVRTAATLVGLVLVAGAGCVARGRTPAVPAAVPRELDKVTHPAYVIEPPDVVQVDLITAVPKPPYRIRSLDVIGVSVPNALPESPLSGGFTVEPGGTVYLGPEYGTVPVAGMTLEEARAAVERHLARILKKPVVSVSLIQTRAAQQVRGPHLVRSDGTIGLGSYGAVYVTGLTVGQAKQAIEAHLQEFFENPEVAVDLVGYNSKVYYVVFDYGGTGQQVVRMPITGNETVLDGIGQVYGLPAVADTGRIWVSRPAQKGCPPQVLPVDWKAVVEGGSTHTNYQLLPGDRIMVKAYPLVETDVKLARLIAPIERVFGITLLGASTVNQIRTDPNQNNGNFNR